MRMLTNEVDLQLNREMIAQDFVIYEIKADSLKDENRAKTINEVYEKICPLSLINPFNIKKVLILCKNHLSPREHYDRFTVHQIEDIAEISDRNLARLLIQALPQLKQLAKNTDSKTSERPSSEGNGLYYLQATEKFNSKTTEPFTFYRTLKIDIEALTHDKEKSVITIKGATLTPRFYHANSDGSYPANVAKLPSINVNPFLGTSQKGKPKKGETDYIERGIRKSKMTSSILSLDVKKPEKFFTTKLGILANFNEEVVKFLDKYLTLEWQYMETDYLNWFNEKKINNQYAEIQAILAQYQYQLIMLEPLATEKTKKVIGHLKQQWMLNIELIKSDKIENTNPQAVIKIFIHHNKDYYEDNEQSDPYQALSSILPNASSSKLPKQSLTISTLFDENDSLNKSVLDNAMTEILVKIEIAQGQLLLHKPKYDFRCITAEFSKQNDLNTGKEYYEFDGYNVLDYHAKDNQLSYQYFDEFHQTAEHIEQILSDITNSDYEMKRDDYLVIHRQENADSYYLIQQSNCRALPEFIELYQKLTDIQKAHKRGFEKSWAIKYLDKTANDEQLDKNLRNKLQKIANYPDQILKKEEFFKLKIHYRSKDEQDFIDWIYQTYGYLWNTSLRSADTGYVEALKGFHYQQANHYYFAGLSNSLDTNISNFSVMRKILTNHPDDEPHAVLELMDDTFYVRHRQSTVLPFLFKHLREHQEIRKRA